MQILHLVSDMESSGTTACLGLLARHLGQGFTQRVVCLGGPAGKLAPSLSALRIDCLDWTRSFDPMPLWRLRQLLHAEPPDLVHVWGSTALRSLGLVARRWLPRTLVSDPLSRHPLGIPPFERGGTRGMSRLDRWLLRRVQTIVASSSAEAELYKHSGFADRQTKVIPPGVEVAPALSPDRAADLPDARPSILCFGDSQDRTGFRDAIWAFDMLHYAFQRARLSIVGDGPRRPYLQWFAERLEITSDVDFLETDAAIPHQQAPGDVCWALGVTSSNPLAVLQAMAAGRTVIAADQPSLREIFAHQETGYLVPAGDKVGLCKRTRSLFLDPALARCVGAAARQRAQREFSADAFARNWSETYLAAA